MTGDVLPLFGLPVASPHSVMWQPVPLEPIHEIDQLVAAKRYARLTRPDPDTGHDLVLVSPDHTSAVTTLPRGHAGVLRRMLAGRQLDTTGRPIRVRLPAGERPARLLTSITPSPLHPLSTTSGVPIGLHRDAGPLGHSFHLGLRCGGCAHRQVAPPEVSGRQFPKCAVGGWVRASQGVATDVFSYWPACVDFQPRDTGGTDIVSGHRE